MLQNHTKKMCDILKIAMQQKNKCFQHFQKSDETQQTSCVCKVHMQHPTIEKITKL